MKKALKVFLLGELIFICIILSSYFFLPFSEYIDMLLKVGLGSLVLFFSIFLFLLFLNFTIKIKTAIVELICYLFVFIGGLIIITEFFNFVLMKQFNIAVVFIVQFIIAGLCCLKIIGKKTK